MCYFLLFVHSKILNAKLMLNLILFNLELILTGVYHSSFSEGGLINLKYTFLPYKVGFIILILKLCSINKLGSVQRKFASISKTK